RSRRPFRRRPPPGRARLAARPDASVSVLFPRRPRRAAHDTVAHPRGGRNKERTGMVNKVILVGNLGRDPESRSLPSGQPVVNSSLATSRRYKDRDGNRKDETEWHNIVVFGKQAEIAAQYLTKGKQIYLEGRIQTRSWEDKEDKT